MSGKFKPFTNETVWKLENGFVGGTAFDDKAKVKLIWHEKDEKLSLAIKIRWFGQWLPRTIHLNKEGTEAFFKTWQQFYETEEE